MAQAQGQQPAGPRPRIPFVAPIETRDGSLSKDARLVNCYAEKQPDGSYMIYKRPGLAFVVASGSVGFGHDMQTTPTGYAFAVGTAIYSSSISGTPTSMGTATPGPGGAFSQRIGLLVTDVSGGANSGLLVMANSLLYYSSALGGPIAPVTVPWTTTGAGAAVMSHRMAQLDFTCYACTEVGGVIVYGSNVNDPTTWTSTNALSVGLDNGWGQGLAKQLGYIAVFKNYDTEIVYDAGTSPAPLAPIPQMKISAGCVSQDTIATCEGKTFWIAQTNNGGAFPMMMEGGQAKRIGTASVDKTFNLWKGFNYGVAAAPQTPSVKGWAARLNGHLFYCVTSITDNQTLVYDASEGIWSQWTDANGNYFPITAVAFIGGNAPSDSTPYAVNSIMALHATNGSIYYLSPANGTDNGVVFPVDIYTPNEDFGVSTYKVVQRMQFLSDIQNGTTLFVRWNDADYDPSKWSDFREIDLSRRSPFTERCGRFRSRSWHIHYASPYAFRLQGVELDLLGTEK